MAAETSWEGIVSLAVKPSSGISSEIEMGVSCEEAERTGRLGVANFTGADTG